MPVPSHAPGFYCKRKGNLHVLDVLRATPYALEASHIRWAGVGVPAFRRIANQTAFQAHAQCVRHSNQAAFATGRQLPTHMDLDVWPSEYVPFKLGTPLAYTNPKNQMPRVKPWQLRHFHPSEESERLSESRLVPSQERGILVEVST